FRTPLNAILGFSRLLTKGKQVSADQLEKLTIINRSGHHLLSMINDVLDLSKIEAGRVDFQKSSFDLRALVEEVSGMIYSRAEEKGLSLRVKTQSTNIVHVETDLGKLRQILLNLLGNAVKFTDEGEISIRCATDDIPKEQNRCQIVIEVEDTGPGIELARQEKIFEPFVQEGDIPESGGTGLGLSICKNYVDFLGGTIEVVSEPGKGSLFRVRLPAERTEAEEAKRAIDDEPKVISLAVPHENWKILIADDSRENLLLLRTTLEEVGFSVLEARNGKEAVELFSKESPHFIWMDMRMPIMDGYEAVKQIRQHPEGAEVPISAITASAFKEQRQEILAAGCNDM
ncbi:MAG: ATP-binding response regulator, partial [Desulfobulbia bacterium]